MVAGILFLLRGLPWNQNYYLVWYSGGPTEIRTQDEWNNLAEDTLISWTQFSDEVTSVVRQSGCKRLVDSRASVLE